jgi:hypothetical protein
MNRLAAPCQALEREWRWGRSARIKGGGAELARERTDRPLRPAIEGMRQSIPRFSRVLKRAPLIAPREAEQYHGSRFHHTGNCAELTRLRVKRAAHRETDQGGAPRQLIEVEHDGA